MGPLGAASSFRPDNSSRLGSDAPPHLGGAMKPMLPKKLIFPITSRCLWLVLLYDGIVTSSAACQIADQLARWIPP
jgi:hypothetical protein